MILVELLRSRFCSNRSNSAWHKVRNLAQTFPSMSRSITEVVSKNWAWTWTTPRNGAQSYARAIPSGDFCFEHFHTPTKIIFAPNQTQIKTYKL